MQIIPTEKEYYVDYDFHNPDIYYVGELVILPTGHRLQQRLKDFSNVDDAIAYKETLNENNKN